MVTRQEYNNALDVIDEFHMQLAHKRFDTDRLSRTPLKDWLELNAGKMSVRLYRGLIDYIYYDIDTNNHTSTIEDLISRPKKLLRVRNLGMKSFNEFEEILKNNK